MIVACLEYFELAKQQYSKHAIADALGLHIGTIKRWDAQKNVPQNYIYDLCRLLGKPVMTGGIDQFYTKPNVAEKCFALFQEQLVALNIDERKYHYIEPSAGCGHFYNLLPRDRRFGVDIDPKVDDAQTADYLCWLPPEGHKYLVIGNPPFGLRGHLALQFINYSYQFSDVVGFILPQLFDSDGKGVPSKRVRGYELAFSERLPSDSFENPDGSGVAVNTLFQVWTKINIDKIPQNKQKSCESFVRIYSLSDGGTPSSTRNKHMIGKCDVYIPSTCYAGMRAYTSFYELPNQRGYGLVINKNKDEIVRLLLNHDWQLTAFMSTNSAVNMRMSLIRKVITDGGFYDDKRCLL